MTDIITKTVGFVGVVKMNRPPDNYFDLELIAAIADAFDACVAQGMRAILLCAEGRNFCAGADFKRSFAETVGGGEKRDDHLYRHAVRLFRCPLPIVAVVQGAAVGGGLGVAMVGDFRVASERSRFAANFSRLGFHPGFGLSVTLPRVVGHQNASLLFYTGRRINGDEAHRLGLVDVLAPNESLFEAGLDFASEIAGSAPLAVQSTRATLRGDLADRIAAATEHELAEQTKHLATLDFQEGTKAMAERRAPRFLGR